MLAHIVPTLYVFRGCSRIPVHFVYIHQDLENAWRLLPHLSEQRPLIQKVHRHVVQGSGRDFGGAKDCLCDNYYSTSLICADSRLILP